MDDSEKKEEKAEEAVDEAKEASEKSEEAAEKAEDSAEEAKDSEEKAEKAEEKAEEAAEEAKEAASEAKEDAKEEPKKEIKVSGKLADIIKDIEELSVMELSQLVKALEEKFGVSAAAPVAVAGAAPAAGGDEEQEEGQTSFNVVLTDGGANKISVIKAVRELVPTLGLKEAKDLVDGAPKQVLEGVGKDAAGEAKKKLEDAGGKVELK